MEYQINKNSILKLTELVKNEILDEELKETNITNSLNSVHQNHFNLFTQLSQRVVLDYYNCPPPMFIGNNFITHSSHPANIYKCEDNFSQALKKKILHYTTIFDCLSNDENNYSDNVISTFNKLFQIESETIWVNELELPLINLANLIKMYYQDKNLLGCITENISIDVTDLDKSNSSHFVSIKYNNPEYQDNVTIINRSLYSYNFIINHIGRETSFSESLHNFENINNRDLTLPKGIVKVLDDYVFNLYCNANKIEPFFKDVEFLIQELIENINLSFRTYVENARKHFSSKEEKTNEQLYYEIINKEADRFRYSNTVKVFGNTLLKFPDTTIYYVSETDDIILSAATEPYYLQEGKINKVKDNFIFNYRSGSVVSYDLNKVKNQPFQCKLFSFFILSRINILLEEMKNSSFEDDYFKEYI